MQLKKYTDYSLRVLIFVGLKPQGELASIKEISDVYDISHNHLGKIVHELTRLELLEGIRGRGGGIRLAKNPEEINIGKLIRVIERDFALLECFNTGENHCVISPGCTLKHVLNKALHSFYHVLDQYTLKDLIANEEELRSLMTQKL
ncbi:RrF2 family transcriptional regulator [Ornithinibacillus halotolerans]|uniref:HTH-type transcriptional regulator NsrR n=1 Tax=Ornithinibacillus halotolerans TaxID=1274357 RepID=A0A916W8Z2_9BACI|nr:Rrf2 family transcriptional regulator [Ornithinibacillus halotolerans]GGA77105.1 HTH-type transcriptional regulator NsrR [Ornithinibacillus halotolerans]